VTTFQALWDPALGWVYRNAIWLSRRLSDFYYICPRNAQLIRYC